MDREAWEVLRDLEKQVQALDHQLVRLHESNLQLTRINGFILSAIIVELIMIIIGGMQQ